MKLLYALGLICVIALTTSKQPLGIEDLIRKEYSEEKEVDHHKDVKQFFGRPEITIRDIFEELMKKKPKDPYKDDCLVPVEEAKALLKSQYGIDFKGKPSKNIRFILGKCHPVIFIPGLYATRLVFTINCKGFAKEDNGKKLMEARLFCGESICHNETMEYEEHVLFPALFNSGFTLIEGKTNKHSACLGYFEQYYNTRTECPKQDNGKDMCYYSDYVRISYEGGTRQSEYKSQCGLKSMRNIISSGILDVVDDLINSGAPKVFDVAIKAFESMGYRRGFSLGGVPLDYRRFVSTNNFTMDAFKYHINRLYENTGKPVVIIGHSMGNIPALSYLLSTDNKMKKKVKTFVAMNPPFAGTPILINIFLYGTKDFDSSIKYKDWELFRTSFDMLGQSLLFQTAPIIAELRPLPVFSKLFKTEKYAPLARAIEEFADLHMKCHKKNCDPSYVQEHSKLFKAIYGNIFPSLDEKECQLTSNFEYGSPCRTGIHQNWKCPTVMLVNQTTSPTVLDNLCGVKNSSLLYNVECGDNTTTCLDSLYKNSIYPYDNPKFEELIRDFNANYSARFNFTLDKSYFDDKETNRRKMVKIIEHYEKISTTKDLPIPPVDTVLFYADMTTTQSGYTINLDSSKTETDGNFYKAGDGTVSNWSSFLVGLKWLYDKKVDNLPQNITLIQYCSTLSKPGEKYAFDKSNKDRAFMAIPCECLNDDYRTYNEKANRGLCHHSTDLADIIPVRYYQEGVITDDKSIFNVTPDRINAVKKYSIFRNYEKQCNRELRKVFEKDSG